MSLKTLLFVLLMGGISSVWAGTADPNYCVTGAGALAKIGYYDYRDHSPQALERRGLVEGAHFTASVRQGIAGHGGSLIGDLDYVLRHIPNHPAALMVMIRVQKRRGFSRKKAMRRDSYYDTTECYLNRAVEMAPDDPTMYLIRAIVSHQDGKTQLAEQDYLRALSLKNDYAEAHYNVGLLYFQIKKYSLAKTHADQAYGLGYPLPGLRDKLASVSEK